MLTPQRTAPAVLPLAERALSQGGAGSSPSELRGYHRGPEPVLAACWPTRLLAVSPGQQPRGMGQCGACLAELWTPHFESKVNPFFLRGRVSFPGQL